MYATHFRYTFIKILLHTTILIKIHDKSNVEHTKYLKRTFNATRALYMFPWYRKSVWFTPGITVHRYFIEWEKRANRQIDKSNIKEGTPNLTFY